MDFVCPEISSHCQLLKDSFGGYKQQKRISFSPIVLINFAIQSKNTVANDIVNQICASCGTLSLDSLVPQFRRKNQISTKCFALSTKILFMVMKKEIIRYTCIACTKCRPLSKSVHASLNTRLLTYSIYIVFDFCRGIRKYLDDQRVGRLHNHRKSRTSRNMDDAVARSEFRLRIKT